MNHKLFFNRLSELVARPSVSCTQAAWDMSNEAVVNLLANWYENLGFDSQIVPIEGSPGKFNLIASKGSGPGGLVLAGHTDTVPCNPEAWEQDPFTLTEKDHKLYGLGATDMKGFFPTVMAALEKLGDVNFKQPVIILATADEESTMSGARALAASGTALGRYAVIGEPTGMHPIRMHKGILMEAVRITGQAGHSSNPALGKNAMEVMNKVISELLLFRAELQEQHHNPGFAVASPTLNLGCIHGGDNPNRICHHCELHFDLRALPGMNNDDLRLMIQKRLHPIAERAEVKIEFEQLFGGVPPFEEPANATIVQAAQALTGYTAESVAFATEAPLLQQTGMETLIMGPGSINQAHQPNEFIETAQIAPAVNVIAGLIQKLCL